MEVTRSYKRMNMLAMLQATINHKLTVLSVGRCPFVKNGGTIDPIYVHTVHFGRSFLTRRVLKDCGASLPLTISFMVRMTDYKDKVVGRFSYVHSFPFFYRQYVSQLTVQCWDVTSVSCLPFADAHQHNFQAMNRLTLAIARYDTNQRLGYVSVRPPNHIAMRMVTALARFYYVYNTLRIVTSMNPIADRVHAHQTAQYPLLKSSNGAAFLSRTWISK